MIVEFSCETCGQRVRKRRSPANTKTPPRFCSQRCHGAGARGKGRGVQPNAKVVCAYCGNERAVYRAPSAAPPKFCSLVCLGKAQLGAENPAFTGGRHVGGNGYVYVLAPDHPQADGRGYVYEHRLVMERAIGRQLSSEEVVHHIDEDKTNNALDNLRLFASQGEHTRHHAEARR